MEYEIVKDERTDAEILKRTDTDGKIWWIPMDESNSDYQAYLRWLENPDAELGGTL
jgi:hypothetical protein